MPNTRPTTLGELEDAIRERRARLYCDRREFSWDITITAREGKRIAQATADTLEDAIEMALLRYDIWSAQ